MSNFIEFRKALQERLEMMGDQLFVVDIDKDVVWDHYLVSFPEGTNPLYKERTEHDCNCCKQFIRDIGRVVAIKNRKLISIWDVEIVGEYSIVAEALSKLVKNNPIKDVYFHESKKVGVARTHQQLEDGNIKPWEHYHAVLPGACVLTNGSIPTKKAEFRSNFDVLKRSLGELSLDSAETVIELIDQNSLYRGEEHKATLNLFVKTKNTFDKLSEANKDLYCWKTSLELKGASKIRNTVIGTLLSDLSEGKPLEASVKSFEAKVAPTNYKRPKALVTPGMIKKAQAKVEELGIQDSLARRHAVTSDLTINNVVFADRTAKQEMNVFDEMLGDVTANVDSLKKVEEIGIESFINDVVPKADTIEMLLEGRHKGNLMSLIAPVHAEAPNILKWDNNFSWTYNGEVTDSIKERVKAAGGNVEGVLRCSLSWFNSDDLDIHVQEPKGGTHIYYGNKRSLSSGSLDVDMNAGGNHNDKDPVENIIWTNKNRMPEGEYKVVINNFSKRNTTNVGFEVEIEFEGETKTFVYNKEVSDRRDVVVATFNYSRDTGIKIITSIGDTSRPEDIWDVRTTTYQKVNMIMNSPNHWDDNHSGNKHTFFMLEGCANPDSARGFYNEFLSDTLHDDRKVFEVLGSKMKVPESDEQLSGVGFSSTLRNHAYFKVKGSFSRIVKVNF